ncbi:hypothetical protein DV737_g5528, partial [Chaetothyriales sp. CBS 132003]
MPSRLTTPVLALDVAKLKEVDPRNVESLFSLWAMFNQCSHSLKDGRRLENMSWRLWARETLCCPPQPEKAIVPQLDLSWQSQVPSLSNSVASDDEEEILEDDAAAEPRCRHRSHSPMSDDSALSKSRGHETHLSADTLKKIVIRIQAENDLGPLSPSLEASLPPLKHADAEFAAKRSTDEDVAEATCGNPMRESTDSCISRTTVATTASTNASRASDHRSSDTSVSSDGLIRSGSVVHGFSPASTSFRAKAMQGMPMPQPSKLAPQTAKKPNMFQLGASSEEEESSFEAKVPRFGPAHSPSDDEKPAAAEQHQFRRVESRPTMVSRPSMLSMQLEQKQRASSMQNGNSRSQPAFQRTRTTSLNQPTLATSPEEDQEEDAGLVMQSSKAKPRPIIMTQVKPQPSVAQAHSPRTTRRNMLASELGESLRKNLLWERQQKSQTANAFLKRSRNAQSMANLQGAAVPCPPHWNNRQSWNNEFENPWEFNAKGWPVMSAAAPVPKERDPENPPHLLPSADRGCRAGPACPFLHAANPASSQEKPGKHVRVPGTPGGGTLIPSAPPVGERPISTASSDSRTRVVTKPIPAAQQADPHGFEVKQVERRFSPAVSQNDDYTILAFKLTPSDPDFPFELDGLHILLKVPKDYRKGANGDNGPSIRVTNPEIERGFQINVERGFDSLVRRNPGRTLLSLLNELDRNLEAFLTAPKAQTIKIVAHSKNGPSLPPEHPVNVVVQSEEEPSRQSIASEPRYTPQQKAEAHGRREAELRQLETRLRNISGFSRHGDGTTFNVPLTIPKPDRLPTALYPLKEATLIVPPSYPLQPCSIKLRGVDGNAVANVEAAFMQHAIQEPQQTLMAHINHLIHNLHLMVKDRELDVNLRPVSTSLPQSGHVTSTQEVPREEPDEKISKLTLSEGKPHVYAIPRPPEWDHRPGDSDEEESTDFDSEMATDSQGEGEEEEGGAKLEAVGTSADAPGSNSILFSLPNIELYGIELLEIASCSLSVRCLRCKTGLDLKDLRAKTSATTATVSNTCLKCSVHISASFTAEPLHANSIRAGHLELIGCTVADMLPSVFQPTCSNCSTPLGVPPGVVAVRGDTSLSVCRACHQKMTFKIPEAKFLRVSSAADGLPLRQKNKTRKADNLGIVAGTPLPNFGRCAHYRKSQRWFRFSCCQKVYPCDKCHDEQVQEEGAKHANEHANRMICGYCSREQNYRPDDCGICHASLVGRKGGGFWEGGKGTRDRVKMSRKDPRKYRYKKVVDGEAAKKKIK